MELFHYAILKPQVIFLMMVLDNEECRNSHYAS